MITQVKLVNIPVRNQLEALKFYTEKLAFEVLVNVPLSDDGSKRWIKVVPPGAQTAVVLSACEGQDTQVQSGPFNIVFSCADLHKTYEELKSKGVEFTQEPIDEPWGSYAQFKDLDGNEFVLSAEPK